MDPIGRPNRLSRSSGSGVLAGMVGEEMSNVFSDEQLKMLKTDLIDPRYISGLYCPSAGILEALIQRLEAAEKICVALQRYLTNRDHADFDLSLMDWRKSKGEIQ